MLHEIKTNNRHYFVDGENNRQGEYKTYLKNGALSTHCLFKDEMYHGEYRGYFACGRLGMHSLDRYGEEIIDFLDNPELYPRTNEERVLFVLKYGLPLLPFGDDL